MFKFFLFLSFYSICNIALAQQSPIYSVKATFYSKKFDGRKTYSGERFNSGKYTAAHRSFPLQSLVKVINPKNNKSVIVRINDRFYRKNFIDLSLIAAKQIDIVRQGTAKIKMQLLDSSFLSQYLKQTSENVVIEPGIGVKDELIASDSNQKYYIRIASFKLKKTAQSLLTKNLPEKLKHIGSIQKTRYKGKPLYKVIIGPFSTKEEASIIKTKLKSKFKDAVIISDL